MVTGKGKEWNRSNTRRKNSLELIKSDKWYQSTHSRSRMDATTIILSHFMIKLLKSKDKKKTWKTSKGKRCVTFKGAVIWLTVDFSKEIEIVKQWNFFIVLKENGWQPWIWFPAKAFFKYCYKKTHQRNKY